VIHAGDPDAEGQALVDNVIAAAGFKGPVKRFWASAMTEAHLKKAFETMSPNEAFQGYRVAATARAQSDWLIGLNLTRALTLKARSRGLEGVFSVGRVQTPTLALIAEREHLHTHFVPQVFGAPWVEGEHGGVFRARLITEGGKASEDETEEDEGTQGVLPAGGVSPEKAARIVADITAAPPRLTVEEDKRTPKTQHAPMGFSLLDLQKEAHSRWKWAAKKTLTVAQSLYEKKMASYPRTDCSFLSLSHKADAVATLNTVATWASLLDPKLMLTQALQKADPTRSHPVWNDAKITAHHAILPMPTPLTPSALTEDERALLGVIAKRYVGFFLLPYRFEERHLTVSIAGHRFLATARRVVDSGFMAFEGATPECTLNGPDLKKGQALPLRGVGVREGKTTPPPLLTESTLLSQMKGASRRLKDPVLRAALREAEGLGTEATRAQVIEDLKLREYITSDKKGALTVTEKGALLLSFLPENLKAVDMTAIWQSQLREAMTQKSIKDPDAMIAHFVQAQVPVLQTVLPWLDRHFSQLQKDHPIMSETCRCGAPLRRIEGKFGPFFGCTAPKDVCGKTYTVDAQGKPKEKPPVEKTEHVCPHCHLGKLVKKQGKKGPFYQCNQCKEFTWAKSDGQPEMTPPRKCPACDDGMLTIREGTRGAWWGCSNYKKGCTHTENQG
jgi:DNA topoisomerase III